jgi:hypothetical protein
VSRVIGERGFDAFVVDPSGDLLDMDRQARARAEYVKLHEDLRPFTVGVFGEWGEGKTSLVRLLRFHLEHPEGHAGPRRPARFVWFSSWAYNTTEKLWRALVTEIARVLYKERPGAEKEEAEGHDADGAGGKDGGGAGEEDDLAGTVARFLKGDAFHLRKPPPERDDYADVLKRLEGTDYGQVREHGGVRVNEEAMMSAVLKGAVAALSTVSPLVAGLRSLFGLESKVELAQLMRKEAVEASREKVEALTRFHETFRDIIGRAGNEPVYIFVDDLDRAQPDVALDIVESIRIALWDTRCVFIIAVDSRLIEQGLRIRYKELFKEGLGGNAEERGREYLEKIIQFSTRLPSRTPEQIRRFVAAQFPEWAAAGDIIELVAGTNPRRVKQYCQHLTFQQMVGARTPTPTRRRADTKPTPTRPTGTGDGIKEEPLSPKLQELFDELMKLNSDERGYIYQELGIDPDKLEGETIGGKIRSAIRACEREDTLPRLGDLIADIYEKRMNPKP